MRNPFAVRPQTGIRNGLFRLLLVVFVPLILLEVFTLYKWYDDRKKAEMQANLELARAVGKNFETFLQGLARSELGVGLALVASRPTDRDRDRILDGLQKNNPAIRSVFWMSQDGLVVASSLRSYIGFDLSDRSFFRKVTDGQDWAVSELVMGRATGKPAFTVSRGVRSERGELLGVVAASVEPDRLDSVLGIGRSKDAGVSLIDNKGMHVYRYPPASYTWEQRDWLRLYPILGEALKGKELSITQVSRISGARRIVAFVPIPSIGWVASCSRAEREVIAGIVGALLPQALVMLLVTLGAFGAAVGLSRPLTASLLRLKDQAEAIGRGEREQVEVEGVPGELKNLADTLNLMTEKIGLREEALRQSEERFRLSMEATSDGLWDWNAKTDEVYYSPSYYRILGYEPGGFPGTLQAWKEMVHPEDLERVVQVNMDCVAGHSETLAVEYRMKARTSEWRWILGRGKCITRDRKGRATRLIGTHVDITERKRAEEELRLANQELEGFNKAMVGRELRMIELKREINDVCTQLGQPRRYPFNDGEEQS